jgi:uncharacterized protein (TIGR03000 family)
MFQKLLTSWGTPALTAAALFLTAGHAAARGGGGGGHFGGGGGHFGGGYLGDGHLGGYGGHFVGYRGFSPGSVHYGSYGRFRPSYGYRRYYRGYYPYYSYYPYYGTYPSEDDYLNYDSDGYSTDASASDAPASGSDVRTQPDQRVAITVKLPAHAKLWFDKRKTKETGPVRKFHSPPLKPGQKYTYTIRARWKKKGHTVTQMQKVVVSAGAHLRVNFPAPRKTG